MALHHAAPGEKVHLARLSDVAHVKSAALVKTDAFEAAQLFLRSGDRIADHAVPGFAILHCLEGSLLLEATEQIELASGDWVYLERGLSHSLFAREDSSLLLTILFE
jgi:quercetin dioxygenase-like cupin family protein